MELPRFSPGEPIRLSASTFVAWKRCPENANARLQGVYGPDTRASFLGNLAHRIFARHLTRGPIADEDFAQACREEIGGSTLNNRLSAMLKTSSLDSMIDEVRRLYHRFVRFPGEGFRGAEVMIEVALEGDVELVGTIDAVYAEDLGGHRLVDWKTGEIGEAEHQLGFYALLWALDRGELPVGVEAYSVGTGESRAAVPSAADVQEVADEVTRLVEELRAAWAAGSDLPRRAGPWCRHCPVLEGCEEGQSAEALLRER